MPAKTRLKQKAAKNLDSNKRQQKPDSNKRQQKKKQIVISPHQNQRELIFKQNTF